MFYLSDYLESNRQEYYQRLNATSQEGDWTGWIKFFLKAIAIQAEGPLIILKEGQGRRPCQPKPVCFSLG
jgi:Fic family protein